MLKSISKKCLPRSQGGLSLVELMVGLAIGLIVTTGAISLFVTNVSTSRRTLADTRVQQDLRTIADLITRDLRRAGYWGNAIQGTIAIGTGTTTTSNVYVPISPSVSNTDGQITYNFSRDVTENNALDGNEQFGFRRNGTDGTVEMLTGVNTWQALNDPRYVRITALKLTDSSPSSISLGYRCPINCSPGSAGCPTVQVRRYDLSITGQSVLDSSVVRTLETKVRVRNDQMAGQCPV